MSLINEALKKAQRQRSLDAAPLSSAPSGVAAAAVATHVRAATHRRSYAPVWFGLGLLVLGAGVTAVIMHYGAGSATAPVVAKNPPAPVALQPAPTPVVATPAPAPAAPPMDPVVVLPPITPIVPPAAPPPIPSPAPATPAVPASPTTVAATPTEPAPVPAAPAAVATPVAVAPVNVAALSEAERSALVYAFLNSARLTGVRGTGTSARVLMNEKVYRLNDIVDQSLGLRLSAVNPNLMVFTDAQGKTYEKPY